MYHPSKCALVYYYKNVRKNKYLLHTYDEQQKVFAV